MGDKAMAILQVIFMLLLAFLLGFAVSWLLREQSVNALGKRFTLTLGEKEQWQAMAHTTEKDNVLIRKQLAESQQVNHFQEAQFRDQRRLAEEMEKTIMDSREELTRLNHLYSNLKSENDSLREVITHLKKELEVKGSTPQVVPGLKPIAAPSRFTPNTWQTRDDLTLIKGIGPVIQKKLMELGIHTFRQISEFTEEDIARVSAAIRFFPGRIQRDHWPSQAAALMAGR